MTNQAMPVGQSFPAAPKFQQPQMTYVDRPDISETFADSVARLSVEGFNAKLEFVVNRMDDPKPASLPTGKAMTAMRLVMPLPGLVDLHGKIGQLIESMKAKGVIKQMPMVPQAGGIN